MQLAIPYGLEFEDLDLRRDPVSGAVHYRHETLSNFFTANRVDLDQIEDVEEFSGAVLAAWYAWHIAHGGERDAVMDDIEEEVRLADGRVIPAFLPERQ